MASGTAALRESSESFIYQSLQNACTDKLRFDGDMMDEPPVLFYAVNNGGDDSLVLFGHEAEKGVLVNVTYFTMYMTAYNVHLPP